ncbi:MAG TPA: SGNH/GDSL hydrolase family protein, partial [Kutzneria sp.]|nr:SGNH/GDSL hydrolase family protein [Kutzneria sp.]
PGGNQLRITMATGQNQLVPGPVGTIRFDLPAGSKEVVIWLPYNEITELVALRTDAPIEPVTADRRVWLHHGSSISHGSNAASPSSTWAALAATKAGVELINLGFGGACLLDPFTARAIRDTAADVITLKLGINIVNADLMRLRAFGPAVHGFLDTIREGHPSTPLLVVSPIYCPIHEETPGPAMPYLDGDRLRFRATGEPAPGKLTLAVIREELSRIVKQRAADDPNLYYLDGQELYGEGDPALPDDLHPDAETHRLIGARFAELAFRGPLAQVIGQ